MGRTSLVRLQKAMRLHKRDAHFTHDMWGIELDPCLQCIELKRAISDATKEAK